MTHSNDQWADRLTDQWADTTTDPTCESVDRSYGRTRRTNEESTYPPLESFRSVPRARISEVSQVATERRRFAPACMTGETA